MEGEAHKTNFTSNTWSKTWYTLFDRPEEAFRITEALSKPREPMVPAMIGMVEGTESKPLSEAQKEAVRKWVLGFRASQNGVWVERSAQFDLAPFDEFNQRVFRFAF
jgi:hypothetical protein